MMGKLKAILLPERTAKVFKVKPGQLAKYVSRKFGLIDFKSMSLEHAELLISKGFEGLIRKPLNAEPTAKPKERKKRTAKTSV